MRAACDRRIAPRSCWHAAAGAAPWVAHTGSRGGDHLDQRRSRPGRARSEPGTVRLRVWNSARKGMRNGAEMELNAERARTILVVQPRVHGAPPEPPLHLRLLGAVPHEPHRQRRRVPDRRRCPPIRRRSASPSVVTPTARSTPRRASRATTCSRSTAGWRRSGTTSTSISATRSIRTARSAACRPRSTVPAKWAKYRRNLWLRASAEPSPRDRALQPVGRPRVHQRLHASRSTASGSSAPRADRVHGLRTGQLHEPQRALPARSAGASTSSSSSSTSARSGRRRCATVVRERPRADRAAGSAHRSSRRSSLRSRTRSAGVPRRDQRPAPDDARRPSVRGVHDVRCAPRLRPGR